MGKFAYAALPLELQLGMGMIVFAIIMSLPIRWMTPKAILSLSCLLGFPLIDKLF